MAGAIGGRRRGPHRRADAGSRRAAAGDDDGASAEGLPRPLRSAQEHRRGVVARRGLHRCALHRTGRSTPTTFAMLASGELDFEHRLSRRRTSSAIEAGVPIKVLAGLHSGCLELIANDSIGSITDLKGKRVGVFAHDFGPACAGDPDGRLCRSRSRHRHRVGRRTRTPARCELFNEGKIDAFLGVPPEPQEQRARKSATRSSTRPSTGHGRSTSAACLPAARTMSTDIRSRPSVSLRAILKAADICASDPERWRATARSRASSPTNYDYALQALDAKRATTSGGTTTPRTRCASTRCGCTKSASSSPAQTRSSPTARTGVPQRDQARVEDVSGWPAAHLAAGAARPGRRMRMTRRTTSACRRSGRRRTLP